MSRLFSIVTVMAWSGLFIVLGGQFVIGMSLIGAPGLLWWIAFIGWGLQ